MKKMFNWKLEHAVICLLFLGAGQLAHAETIISDDGAYSVSKSLQQKITITGTVTSEAGDPIIGALIIQDGTPSNGTVTDVDGKYSLEVPDNSLLNVTYIGYEDQQVSVAKKGVINIVLKESALAADEVVVVGYGTQKKSNLAGAISVVDSEDISFIPTNSLSQTLAGRAPGVNITTSSGMAGASSSISMRGSSGEPLYVINNVISDKEQFDALNPNEVENISFLKDAASAAIYGSKAGNGVVVVTTKAGKEGKPKFTYKGSYSISNPIHMQNHTATDELNWANNRQDYLGLDPIYDQEDFDYFKDKSYNVNDYIWQNPFAIQNDLSVNGGGEKVQYFMMLGYQNQEGSYHNLDYKRFNFRSDVTAQISNRIKVNLNLGGNQRDYNRFYWPYDSFSSFTVPDLYRATFNWTKLYPFYVDDAGNPTTDQNANPVSPAAWHPVELVNGDGYQRNKIRSFTGQIRFDIDLEDLVKGLSTAVMAQYDATDNFYKALILHNESYLFQSASPENPYIPGPIDPNQILSHNLSSAYNQISENMNMHGSYQFNWFLNYARKFGKHDVSGMLVYEQGGYNGNGISGNAQNMLTTSIDQIYVTSGDTKYRYFNGWEGENARQSLIGRFNYNYDEKYIAEFSFRYDGNYKFAPQYNWGFFPSVSLAWRVSEENFMKDVDWLSSLKLRASYGSTGSDDGVSAFQWTESFNNGSGYIFGGGLNQGLQEGAIANPYITWSKFETYNVGLDFGFLDNKLKGEIDFFQKKQSDILGARINSVPGTFGASLPAENYAERQWKGFEISLGWRDQIGDFNLSANANLGYAIDKWLVYDEPEGLEEWRSRIGHPASRVYGYYSDGLIRTQADLDALPEGFTQFGREPQLGTILYRDIRGANYSEGPDGNIDGNDMDYLSDNGAPRINYGLNLAAEWKGLSISALFQGVGAYDKMVTTMNGAGVFQTSGKPYFDVWATGDTWRPDNTDAKYPVAAGKWQEEYGIAGSTYWLDKGAYMRLKNLNIGYTLPKKWYSRIGVNAIQIFANGTNLFCISSFDMYDPEQSTLDSYPLMKTFTGGVTINF